MWRMLEAVFLRPGATEIFLTRCTGIILLSAIRRYALSDGALIVNKQVREARKKEYPWIDIKNSIVPRYWRSN